MSGSSAFHASRAAVRWLRRARVGLAALSLLLASVPAFGQSAGDSGWFDPPQAGPADPAPEPYYEPPVAQNAPTPLAEDAEVPDADPSALTEFRPALDPYGSWVADSKYGTVWVPHRAAVGADFAPYVSRGHWSLTADDDWIWVSDYPFGWAVFHYGRWVWISGNGWAWVPGRTYANAWVVWRVPTAGYAYVGWAPMPPSYVWMNGYAVSLGYGPPVPYVFCSSSYIFHRHVHHHIVHDRHLVHRLANHTRVYPTTYRAPARPTRHTAAAPNARGPAPAPISAPRGPRMAAARVPSQAIPAQRTAPPAAAARLAPRRIFNTTTDAPRQRTPADSRVRAAERLRGDQRPVTSEPVRRSTPSSPSTFTPATATPAPRERSAAPARVRSEPRTTAPVRVRPEPRAVSPVRVRPPAPSRDLAPASRRMRRP